MPPKRATKRQAAADDVEAGGGSSSSPSEAPSPSPSPAPSKTRVSRSKTAGEPPIPKPEAAEPPAKKAKKEKSDANNNGGGDDKQTTSTSTAAATKDKGKWEDKEQKDCLLIILSTLDVKMTKELSAVLQKKTGRSSDAIGNWWSKKVQTELKKIRSDK